MTGCWSVFRAIGTHPALCCEADVVAFWLLGRRIEARGTARRRPRYPDIVRARAPIGLGPAMDLAYKLIVTPPVLIDVKA